MFIIFSDYSNLELKIYLLLEISVYILNNIIHCPRNKQLVFQATNSKTQERLCYLCRLY